MYFGYLELWGRPFAFSFLQSCSRGELIDPFRYFVFPACEMWICRKYFTISHNKNEISNSNWMWKINRSRRGWNTCLVWKRWVLDHRFSIIWCTWKTLGFWMRSIENAYTKMLFSFSFMLSPNKLQHRRYILHCPLTWKQCFMFTWDMTISAKKKSTANNSCCLNCVMMW